jgi:integrase
MTDAPSMTDLARDYLAHRRSLGYQLDTAGPLLLRFAGYADQSGHSGPLTAELAVRWARLPAAASPGYLARRLDVVRGFARYRAIFDPLTEVPAVGLIRPSHQRRTPYVYTDAEASALIAAARALTPAGGLRPHTYAAFFGLLACTGLRVSEALKLARQDVDWGQGVLTVHRTKFRKSRLVPLHPSAAGALRDYAELRDRFHPSPPSEAFFLTRRGTPLGRATVGVVFWRLRKQLPWSGGAARGRPRIHDLRHTFACKRLLRWYQRGVDVDHAIASLATYLGHVGVAETYWYLTGIPELMEVATARFERFASSDGGGGSHEDQ